LAEDVLLLCSTREGCALRCVDRRFDIVTCPAAGEVRPDGDLIYLAYNERVPWIYVYSNDLEIGILFSQIDPVLLIGNVDVENASRDFIESFEARMGDQAAYYDQDLLRAWLALVK